MIPGLFDDFLGVRIFGYITFRVAMAGLTAFALAMLVGKPAIAWLERQGVGEDVSKAPLAELADKAEAMGHLTTTGSDADAADARVRRVRHALTSGGAG